MKPVATLQEADADGQLSVGGCQSRCWNVYQARSFHEDVFRVTSEVRHLVQSSARADNPLLAILTILCTVLDTGHLIVLFQEPRAHHLRCRRRQVRLNSSGLG